MWRHIAASSIGTYHLKANLPCQDRYSCFSLSKGEFIAAIADGAGSALKAEQGAEIAVRTVIAHIGHCLEDNRNDFSVILNEAASLARNAIDETALREGLDRSNYATTLLALIIGAEGGCALQLGDGTIVVSEGGDEWSWVFWPKRGEYANTTFFLTDEDSQKAIEIVDLNSRITDIALMTDGIQNLALQFESQTVYEPFFRKIFLPLHQSMDPTEIKSIELALERFLSSERIRSRTDDDISLILATLRKI